MRHHPIDPHLFLHNRRRYCQELPSGALAVFQSNDVMPTNADGTMPFRQNNDLFYLTGIDQEESILLLFPDAKEGKYREILFVRQTDSHIAVWEGKKFTKEEAAAVSGISTVYWTSSFNDIFALLMGEAQQVFLNTNEHVRQIREVETRNDRFVQWCQRHFPLHTYSRSAPIMRRLRMIKQETEVKLMQQACDITAAAFDRILKFVRPGVWEHEIEAELWHEAIRSRSRGPAYAPIIASGANTCVLHYTDNNRQCTDGNLLLLDIGAEYANYSSDLSRTIPVNGKYSARQADVYNAVLRVMRQAIPMLRPGNTLAAYHVEVGHLMEEELIGLGLLTRQEVENQNPDSPQYKRYFMHGTSHHLGLDTHDISDRHVPFEEGMVFTCEPGIYIPEESIGVRIENDLLITPSGQLDLMAKVPLEIDLIEQLMRNG